MTEAAQALEPTISPPDTQVRIGGPKIGISYSFSPEVAMQPSTSWLYGETSLHNVTSLVAYSKKQELNLDLLKYVPEGWSIFKSNIKLSTISILFGDKTRAFTSGIVNADNKLIIIGDHIHLSTKDQANFSEHVLWQVLYARAMTEHQDKLVGLSRSERTVFLKKLNYAASKRTDRVIDLMELGQSPSDVILQPLDIDREV